jgi:hypothetical protein
MKEAYTSEEYIKELKDTINCTILKLNFISGKKHTLEEVREEDKIDPEDCDHDWFRCIQNQLFYCSKCPAHGEY